MKRWMTALALCVWLPWAGAAIDAFPFDNPDSEARYHVLLAELRCLVCQNQNLADSNAELALDLRRQVYNMVKSGRSNEAIVDYLIARYGDFVLYRPPVRPATYLLWFGPALLLLTGSLALLIFVRRRAAANAAADEGLSGDERRRLERLLEEQPPKGGRP